MDVVSFLVANLTRARRFRHDPRLHILSALMLQTVEFCIFLPGYVLTMYSIYCVYDTSSVFPEGFFKQRASCDWKMWRS